MKSDLPFIITVKASNIYDNNDKYNLINNIKNKELINYIREYIVIIITDKENIYEYCRRKYA